LGLQLAAMLFGDQTGLRCSHCPSNLMRAVSDDARAGRLLDLQRILGGALAAVVIALIVTRWLRASRPERRASAPVLWAGSAALAALIGVIVTSELSTASSVPSNLFFYAFATVPVAVLFVFLQRRLARGAVAGLVVELGEPSAGADLRGALARALGDPSLQLAFWFPAEARYVDGDGRPIVLPDPDSERRSTLVQREGEPIAGLVHDPALEHNTELVQSVCAAAGLTLENERLQAELRARLAELQASRARLVEATDTERRRIERDLHDGTQQRLVSIAMSLGLLESKLPGRPTEAKPLVHETRQALALPPQGLRELTQGIHPTLLAECGLAVALDELCRRSALPAQVELTLDARLPDQVESAAYFFASEALTNAAKHSHASNVRVTASSDGRTLTVELSDDGIGGATPAGASALRRLAYRVQALDGRLSSSR